MEIVIAILLAYAVLFYLLKREGFEIGETLDGFGFIASMIILGVQFINWIFGTAFSDDAWVYLSLGLFAVWTVAATWFLIDEPRKRRQRDNQLRRILNGEQALK